MTKKTKWLRWTFMGLILTLLPFSTYRAADAYLLDSSDPINAISFADPPIISATHLGDSDPTSIFLPIVYNNWSLETIQVANSALLPPGSTQIELTVQSENPTTCRFALDSPDPYEQMTPFDQSGGSTHTTLIGALNPDPNTVNHVYVRCTDQPDSVQEFLFRALSDADPSFPRTANLWGDWQEFLEKGWDYMARIDLWVAWDGATSDQIAELRSRNAHIRVLTSINVITHSGLDDWYYLKDVDGDKIEVWPGVYRLNITNLDVAKYQAEYAYQTVLDTGMMADGVFFDNVHTTQSWLKFDVNGEPVEIDAVNHLGQPIPDGIPDDPDLLDAAWKAGVFHELETFRDLMPHAITNGHAMKIAEPGIAELFNGVGTVYWTADVLEDQTPFYDLWNDYNAWMETAREPQVTMIESSPLDDIAYGYGYPPPLETNVPDSTFDFSHTYYPWVRFGLALTLMNDGYFLHDFGDLWHGQDWWFDELDFDLGYPLGPAARVDLGGGTPVNLIENGGFEADPIEPPWSFVVMSGTAASLVRDTGDAQSGMASAHIDIATTSGTNWHIMFHQDDLSLQDGVTYDVTFWAKSSAPRNITLSALPSSGPGNYGLLEHVAIGTEWQEYTVSFEGNATVSDAKLQFSLGETSDNVWLDDVRMNVRPPDVYRREFTNGLVVLNATNETQTINVGSGFSRLVGSQAPMVETIIDDSDPGFSPGSWSETSYDSGSRKTNDPYYHDWGSGCHESNGGGDVAQWDLPISATDTFTYTVSAWWPAAPGASGWNTSVTYKVFADGNVVFTSTLDQRSGGDEWNQVAEVQLAPGDAPYVRITCTGSDHCIADALLLRSQARYNDGSPAAQVTLQPMDGIVLRRE